MKLPNFIKSNLILKITSVNSTVIVIRLIIALVIQRVLAETIGKAGIARVGQLRNLLVMLTSISTLGIGNGIIKFVSEYKSDQSTLRKLFSSAFWMTTVGSGLCMLVLILFSEPLSLVLFGNESFDVVFKLLAVIVPFIAMQRVFNSVISGLSDYKSYAKIDLFAYLLATGLLLIGLYFKDLIGVLIAIAVAPFIQWCVLMFVFGKTLKEYVSVKFIDRSVEFVKPLLAFTFMSFMSTFLINYVEIDIRNQIDNELGTDEAGVWTAMTNISKNYMVFISGVLSLYVLPKFSEIKNSAPFIKEVKYVFKSLLPLFAIGMLGIYVFRDFIISLIYPDFTEMSALFKWQLIGDFIKLISMILAYQFVAKKLVKTFAITELISLISFYGFSVLFIDYFKTEGVVMAHFVRYVIYLFSVIIGLVIYFKRLSKA